MNEIYENILKNVAEEDTKKKIKNEIIVNKARILISKCIDRSHIDPFHELIVMIMGSLVNDSIKLINEKTPNSDEFTSDIAFECLSKTLKKLAREMDKRRKNNEPS